MAYPATVRAIEAELGRLAADHPQLCTRTVAPNRTHEGRSVWYVTISGAEGGRPVLITGGIHAREWATPDALLSLLERLLRAYEADADFVVAAFTDTAPARDILYPQTSVPAADVKRIVEGLELNVLALINPDGRAFSQSSAANAMWRKNRRPAQTGSSCMGVDLNRNYDLAWDFERYYDDAGDVAVSASKDPCDLQVYVGPAALSEPETQNVAHLLRDRRIEFYVDVHSFSRKILFPWGMDDNQTRDPARASATPPWTVAATAVSAGATASSSPLDCSRSTSASGRRCRTRSSTRRAAIPARGAVAVRRRAGARAVPDDRHRLGFRCEPAFGDDPPAERVIAYTLEIGNDTDGEGGFHPVPAIYPKIEREAHLALMAFLRAAAG